MISFATRYEALRVAFIHSEDVGSGDGGSGGKKEFYSKLVKADIHGKDEVYDILLMLGMVNLSNWF